ncbi:methyl-accepting chemotaxis protein [Paracoccus suum]|uniref:Methyl-accepting chemotaxis protein n=1 Tax=Paracoccus suum TaxID=2259340 RepID=A0A344PGU9_9RHOB|nr:HAMP domain-containing methyl-accepting chemotaxis protein [Paracoccus suum]AXC48604.1 methyl-accepting chemotaxis protein [Paracoccus suum]
MFTISIRRLGIATSAVAVVSTFLTLAGILYLGRIAEQTIDASDNRYQSSQLAADLLQYGDDLTRLARTYVITGNPAFQAQYNDVLAMRTGKKARPKGPGSLYWGFLAAGREPRQATEPPRSLADLMKDQGFAPDELNLLEQARQRSENLVKLEVEAMNAAKGIFKDGEGRYTVTRAPNLPRARLLLNSADYHATKADILVPVQQFFDKMNARLDGTLADLKARQDAVRLAAVFLAVLSILASLAAAAMLQLRVLRPLTMMRDSMARMGAGDLSQSVPLCDRPCEIGQIAREAEKFRVQAGETVRLSEEVRRTAQEAARHANAQRIAAQEAMELSAREQQRMAKEVMSAEKAARFQDEVARVVAAAKDGNLSVRARIEQDYAVGAEIGGGLNELLSTLEATFTELSDVLGRIAAGDLSTRVESRAKGQIGTVLTSTEAARRALSDLVAKTRHNAESFVELAGSIAGAARDLSQRTETNAGTLEESSAALTELTASVRSAAEGAERADRIGRGARDEVEHSNQIVTEAIAAMSQIEASSKRISTIVNVIEGIAFQTNLLALNAGVEAARAGEAGRGFAVVASEVRALAQRSSEAAREINGLISQSTEQVTRGADLVGRTGDALQRILTSVGDISAQISAIALSSREQSIGLSEIDTAVHQLDAATQDNAAMVSETSNSSKVLADQAGELLDSVARFRLPGHNAPRRGDDTTSHRDIRLAS